VTRLATLDEDLVQAARRSLAPDVIAALTRDASEELAAYRERMAADAFERAREAAVTRLIRDRLNLPTIAFT
jgi:hypothetical protein